MLGLVPDRFVKDTNQTDPKLEFVSRSLILVLANSRLQIKIGIQNFNTGRSVSLAKSSIFYNDNTRSRQSKWRYFKFRCCS